ncbi:zeta toxin family protein [Rhodocista pekingensis]|uniref:Zeta toxin family protein n=1 Tax=Rhodocista pekingensis TaxID=201185 RepID=A0ABW2KT82_9PROT
MVGGAEPQFWIVAGCNGAGKTTLTRHYFRSRTAGEPLIDLSATWINPDATTVDLRGLYADFSLTGANLAAADVSLRRLEDHIGSRRPALIETVLASDKYLAPVERARAAGFSIHLIYVTLESPDLAIARVRQRVQQGQHDVPPEKVRQRWSRSMLHLMQFIPLLDELKVFDNSSCQTGTLPPLVISKDPDGPFRNLRPDLLPEIQRLLTMMQQADDPAGTIAALIRQDRTRPPD